MDQAEQRDPEPREPQQRNPAPAVHASSAAPPESAEPGEPPLPPLPSVLKLLARSLRQTAGDSLATRAPTPRGQLAGGLMLLAPALAHPLPLDGALHAIVQLVAVLVGSLGAVIVFGGLVIRAVLRQPPSQPRPRNEALLALPHPRAVWIGLVLVLLLLAAGALWSLVRAFGGDTADRLSDTLLLGLPAAALGWAAWHSRVMRTAPPPDRQPADSIGPPW